VQFAIANYRDHQAALTGLLEAACGKRFVFIEGEKDYGKTWLLQWFQMEFAPRCPLIHVDLAAPDEVFSPPVIVAKCVSIIGSKHFTGPDCAYAKYRLEEMSSPRSAEVSGNKITGNNINITATARGETPREQLVNAMTLTNAFIEDLTRLPADFPPFVISIDGYDHTAPDQAMIQIKQWLDGSLLPGLCAVPQARCVLAGRRLPDVATKAWSGDCAKRELKGVPDTREWLDLARIMKKGYPPKAKDDPARYLDNVVDALKGVPGSIMPVLQGWPAEGADGR